MSEKIWGSSASFAFAQNAFTLIELLICIGIVAVLAGLLFPSVKQMLARGKSVKCVSNLRQIGIGMISYASEHDGLFPHAYNELIGDTTTWMVKTAPYLGMPDNAMGLSPLPRAAGVFVCPEWQMKPDRKVSYGMNPFIDPDQSYYSWNYRRGKVSQSGTFLVVEIAENKELGPQDGIVARRHPDTSANYLFVDGHVENLRELVPATAGGTADPRWTKKEYR